ncbi:hypothetical protein fh0823_16850 [Francisella halioticida]|uniref:Nitronate monooxygenase domain-containing protein n=1 Tax=Francisella halioticida TaxID=549298 RepID=A0ABN5AYM3_9GAMM|nr:nitronate monooxygenase [Francisella halioticida]ASG68630.1 hypothetical protein CDV26_09685 [Francisella halioticida]BCD91546.1 hypothetical protein fh0823_16850 [Francisella halioticida]
MLEKLKFNIIQAPMAGGIVTPEMVSVVSNSGMLGMISSGYLSIQQLEEFILEVKKSLKIGSVFGINLFIEPFVNQSKSYDKNHNIVRAEEHLQKNKVIDL